MELISEAEVDDWLQSDAVQQYIRSIHNGEVSRILCGAYSHYACIVLQIESWRYHMHTTGPPKKKKAVNIC